MQMDYDDDDEIPELDLSKARPARHLQRAKERLARGAGSTSPDADVVKLDPDVAAEFKDGVEVNAALRELIRLRRASPSDLG